MVPFMRKPLKLLTAGGATLHVEAVRGKAAREGFRGRPAPGPQEGLLFIFGRRDRLPDFTMDGVGFGLDLVLLDREPGYPVYTIVGVQHLEPHEHRVPVRATGVGALELAAGEAARLGLVEGSILAIAW